MKFNKKEILNLNMSKVFLFVLFCTIMMAQVGRADANSTPFLKHVMPAIKKESIMPRETISGNKVGPMRALDGLRANTSKEMRKTYKEHVRKMDDFEKKAKSHKFNHGSNANREKHYKDTKAKYQKQGEILVEHTKAKIEKYSQDSIKRGLDDLERAYQQASADKNQANKIYEESVRGEVNDLNNNVITLIGSPSVYYDIKQKVDEEFAYRGGIKSFNPAVYSVMSKIASW